MSDIIYTLDFGRAVIPQANIPKVTSGPEPSSVPRVYKSLLGVPISEADASLLVTDKGKRVYFLFGTGPSGLVRHSHYGSIHCSYSGYY